jgi:hypothetical protein
VRHAEAALYENSDGVSDYVAVKYQKKQKAQISQRTNFFEGANIPHLIEEHIKNLSHQVAALHAMRAEAAEVKLVAKGRDYLQGILTHTTVKRFAKKLSVLERSTSA